MTNAGDSNKEGSRFREPTGILFFHIRSQMVSFDGPKSAPALLTLLTKSIADKFFLPGALAGFFGGLVLGVLLWLMLNGQVAPSPRFADLRALHILVQFHLFFAPFIVGFLLQAGPRLLKTSYYATPYAGLLGAGLVLGVALKFYFPDSLLCSCILSLPYLLLLRSFLALLKLSPSETRQIFGPWIVLSLASFALSAFFALGVPTIGFTFFWGAVVSIVLGMSQQFLFAYVQTQRLSARRELLLSGMHAVATACFLLNSTGGFLCGGTVAFFELILFVVWTGLYCVSREKLLLPISIAFLSGFVWALIGAGSIIVYRASAADSALHMLAVGFATPVLFAVSLQLIRSLTGVYSLSDTAITVILFLWQVVPFGRTGSLFLRLPPSFSLLVAFSAAMVFTLWALAVVASVAIAIRRALKSAT